MLGIIGGIIGGAVALFVFCIFLIVYFLPYIVARNRRHRNAQVIFVLNLLLGWTFFGWVILLIWALTK